MTSDREAFEAWWATNWLTTPHTKKESVKIWHAALAYAREGAEPVVPVKAERRILSALDTTPTQGYACGRREAAKAARAIPLPTPPSEKKKKTRCGWCLQGWPLLLNGRHAVPEPMSEVPCEDLPTPPAGEG